MYRNCSESPEIAEILQNGETAEPPAVKKRETRNLAQALVRVELSPDEFVNARTKGVDVRTDKKAAAVIS